MHVKDQLNRTLYFERIPQRIVSLVPSQTELLVDLGLESHIVGVTKFCVHPSNLIKTKTVVGGTKKIRYDKIKALCPDIIICNKEENTKQIVEMCQSITPTWVSDIYTIDDTIKMIEVFGNLFDCGKKSEFLIRTIQAKLKAFQIFIDKKPARTAAYVIWENPYMIAGEQTFINEMLALNKFVNCAIPNARYPEIDLQYLKDVDLVLLSSEPYPFKEEDVTRIKEALQIEVLLVDGEYFSWYGSRLIKAFDYFESLHE